uniref:Fucosyltransferase n=1 Tax=Daphnia galeata TaxID=27404 RepID=A0A8J2S289_9CRUS|nr:unnamed protein product [Daphnia galeata]
MPPRGKKAVGRTRGSKASRGHGQTSVETEEQNLLHIVNEIPISDAQQELLDDEREEGDDYEVMHVTDDDTKINTAEPPPPPGNPIPTFTEQSWKAKWRRDFFTDWRKCETNKKPHYYSGELTSFSNFEKHLNSCHYEEYSKHEKRKSENDPSQPSLHKFQQSRTMTKDRQKKIDLDLGYTVAIDNIPINILRQPRFRRWIHTAMPGYQLPGIERMRNSIIPSIVHASKSELIKIIKESTSFTIILDIWSSKSMMGYIGFTCHAVTKAFERYTLFLGVKRMIGRHTAENILAEYEQMLRDWEIDRSLVLVVKTDGGSNMVANTFLNSIPGWQNEEELPVNEHASFDYDDPQPSTSDSNMQDKGSSQTLQQNEPMTELEIADSSEDDPLWLLLQELGIKFSEAGVHEDDDSREYRDLEKELEEQMPSNETAPDQVDDRYVLISRLRSDCVAHKLQLVIKDGFKTMSREATSVISHAPITPLPPDSYINAADFVSPKALAEYLYVLDTNPALYSKYFDWKKDWEVIRNPTNGWCDLCEKLNDPEQPPKSYEDIGNWYYDKVPCITGPSVKKLYGEH